MSFVSVFCILCTGLCNTQYDVWWWWCMCVFWRGGGRSAQMELLIDTCAADHRRTHYGNFQLEEPASVRAGRRCQMSASPADPPKRDSNSCTAATPPNRRRWVEDSGVPPLRLSRRLVSFSEASIWLQNTCSGLNNKFTRESRRERKCWLNYLSGQSVLTHILHRSNFLYQKRHNCPLKRSIVHDLKCMTQLSKARGTKSNEKHSPGKHRKRAF